VDWLWFKKLIILLYGSRHNNELTTIKQGAFSLAACTEFPEHPSSPSSSIQLTWQHSICPCVCSPSPKYPGENAHYVCHFRHHT